MHEKIFDSFARQGLMKTLGARLVRVDAGRVDIELPYSDAVTQQHGYFHAAAMAAIADTAGGYAALTLMDAAEEVLAIEFKINLLRPATGSRLIAEATVVRAGRTIIVCQANVKNDAEEIVAMMMQTNFRVSDRNPRSA